MLRFEEYILYRLYHINPPPPYMKDEQDEYPHHNNEQCLYLTSPPRLSTPVILTLHLERLHHLRYNGLNGFFSSFPWAFIKE